MPIINFEYTDNLKIQPKIKEFLLKTHHTLVREINTDLTTCRSSIYQVSDYVIGDGNINNAYIIMRIQMLPGRTDQVKNHLGELLLEEINAAFGDEIKRCNTQVRVYLTETDKPHYYGLE